MILMYVIFISFFSMGEGAVRLCFGDETDACYLYFFRGDVRLCLNETDACYFHFFNGRGRPEIVS